MGDFVKNYKRGEKQRKKYEEYLKNNDRKKLDEEAAEKGREKNRANSSNSSKSKRERASENYMRNAAKSDNKKKKGYFSGVNFNLTPSGIKKALTEGNKNTREAFRVSAAAVSGDRKPLQQWEKENLNDVDRFVLGANTEWAGGVVRGAEWLGDVTGLAKEKNPEKRTGTRLLNESERYKSELKEGKSEAAKFALDLGSQLYLIGADLIVTGGRSALIPMAVRSFGTGVNEAYYSGANLAQQGAYGALNAGVEVATEKLWSAGSKFVNKKGVLDNLTEKTAKKISGAAKRFVKSDKGQDILYRAAKAGIGATEEGLEEAIADAVNPIIQRITYDEDALKQYGDPEYWSDMAYDYAIGAAAGGIMGGISQSAEYRRGKNMTREQQEAELEKALKSDESNESYSYANELLNQSQRGENILPGQFYDLAKKNAAADSRAAKQYNDIYTETLDNETFRKAQEGFDEEDTERAKNIVAGRENAAAETAKAALLKQGVEETQADEYAQSIGRIVAGTAGYADTEVFQGNDAAKAAFQKVTGYALPADNESTRRQATQYAANATYNLAVNMRADIETEIAAENGGSFRASDGTVVETPVMITSPADVATFRKNVRRYSGDTAQRLAEDYTGTVSVGNYTGAFAAFYDAGKIAYTNPQRFNFTWANKINSAWRDFLTTGAARDAYLSGVKAARLASEKKAAAKTNITKKGESKAEDKSKKLSETQNDMAKALAEKTGLDITIAEKLQKVVAGTEVELNGAIDVAMGTLELSLDSDNLGQALAHELTHYVYALNEEGAKELRDAVLSWYAEEKGMKSLSELLENKKQMYGDEVIAEEEFVADALAGIFSNDKGAKSFAQWLTDKSGYSTEQQQSVLQKLIDVIDSILANIKAMFTGNDLSNVSKDMRQLAKQNQKRAEAVRKIYIDALNKASESYKAAETETEANESGVKYSKKSESSSIRNQLRTNIDKLKNMKPVANVRYESIKHLSRSQKAETIMKDFDKKFKGGIERQGFGFIVLRKDEVTDSLKYLHTDGEFAAFKALPQVLKRGRIIEGHEKHKGRAIDTVTIAAPVMINGTDGYMAAAVKVGGKNRYHVHRILMPDGSEFEFNKKTEPIGAGVPTANGSKGSAVSPASNNRVSETGKKSNEKFSMKEPVEESGNLIAVHNIRANELLKTIELGGFAMPSIAVTKADMGHNMYGDISVLFSKDTINPEASKYNKVYSGDAYTPEFPRIDFEIDDKAASELQNHIKQIIGSDLEGSGWGLYLDTNNLEDKINRENGNFVEAYRGNTALQYAFVKDREGSVKLPQKEKPFSHNGKYTNEQVREFAKLLPEGEIDAVYGPNSHGVYEYYKNNPEIVEQIREIRNKDFREKHKEKAEEYAEKHGKEYEFYKEVSFADFDNLLNAIRQYYKEGDTFIADTAALRDTVMYYTAVEHDKEYLNWLADISDGIIAGRGIRNNKDLFTSSGNRRTFKQLHDDVNLANIVKSMRSEAQTGTSFGEYNFMGSSTREYTSIDDIRSDSSRLALEDEKNYNEYVNEIKRAVEALAERLESSSHIGAWDIESCIAEAVAKRKTKAGIRNFLKTELGIPDYVDMNKVADEIIELRDRAQQLPTGYFEAKPQRAIGFDEVKAVIAPDIMNAKLRAAITDAGMELYEYKTGNEEDRLAKVNEAAESKQLRFSVKEDSKGNTLSEQQQEYFKNSKARDENGRLAVVYHGTPAAGFTVFNRNQNYYSDSEELAGTYTNNEGIYEGYLNITNPLVVDAHNEKFSGIPIDYIEVDNLDELMDISGLSPFEEDGMMRTSTADIVAMVEDARDEEMVNYDGVIFRNVYDEGGYGNADVGTIRSNVYVTFRSNQFKDIDNKTPTESADIRYSVKEDKEDGVKHFDITKKDVLDNMKAVSEMEPVEYLAGNEFAKSNVDLVTQVEEYYSSIGGFAENDILGEVELNRNGIKSSIGHGIGRNKAIAFKAVPEVISSGKIIDVQREWKGRSYNAVVIAAPVSIADSDYYMGVIVRRMHEEKNDTNTITEQGYYLHEVMMQKISTGFKTGRTKKPDTGANADSMFSLLQQLNDVNTLSENDIVSSEGRFSIKETNRSEEKLLRENKKYKRLVADLKQQMRLSKGRIPDKGEINKYANRLRTEYKSKTDKEQLVNALTNLYGYMADKNANPEQIWDVARNIANDVIKNSTYNREITDYAKGILEDIKSSKVALSETQKQEVAYVYGSYAEYKRSNKGVNASDNGIYLDEKWQEWAEIYPELFDAELTEPEQGVRLAEITKALSEDYINEFGFDLADATDMLAAEIANEVSQASEMVTFADKKKQQQADKVAKEKAKNREKINAIKQQYKEKYQKQMADQRAKNNQKLTDQRDKTKEQLARQRAKYEQRMADTRARADRRGIKTQIEKDVKYLTGMLLSPTDTKHVPEGYQAAIARMLAGFDFATTRTDAWTKKYGHLSRRMLNFANVSKELLKIAESGESDIVVDDFMTELADKLADKLDGRRLDSLTNEELQDVKALLKAVRYGISNINSTFSDNIKQTRAEAGDKIIEETRKIKDKKNKGAMRKMIDDFLNSSNVKPVDFFEIMGGTAKDVFGAIVDGFDRHIRNVDTAMKYIQGVADKKTLSRLSNEKARPVKFNLSSGETIELMPSQIMSLYCLVKRPQAVEHIIKGGVVPVSLRYKKKLKTQGIIDDKRKQISYTDALMIIDSLSEEEKTIADKLQKFMADNCAAWGNETSMRLYGYKKFDEADYFPIRSSKDFLESRSTEKAELMPKLWTAGFTKALTPKANNPIMLDDIFDVATRHITEMSMYNALAPALLDFERIYNYKQRAEDSTYYNGTTVKEQIRRAYGDKATNYIETLLRDLNNANKRKDKADTAIPNKLLANYKKAKIGFNFRVLIQQPTAIVRSAIMINPKYLIAAQGKPAVKEMQEHCPIAKWKGWGFYQTDVAPSMKEIILGQESKLDKLFMNAYGKADDLTWSYIWKAVKKEVKANNPDIEVGSQEYWEKCNERARDIFYRTQVVDSMLSRSQIMRNDQIFTKMVTSFMAEPTVTFNMMRTETIKTAKEWAAGEKKAATKRMSTLLPVFIANAAAVSAAAAVADYLRDAYTGDDDDEDENQTSLQKYLKYTALNMLDNANPLNMLPFTRDIYSLYSGYDITRMDMATFTTMFKDIERLQNTYEQGAEAKYTYEYGIRQLLLHSAEIFGVPLANIVREGETVIKTAFPNGEAILDSFMYNNPNEVNRKSNYAALLSDDTEKSGKALESIKEDAASRYQEYIDKGKSESQAMSAVRSSLSNYYKGAYQAADTSERSMIVSRISQITVNGRSVWEYADGSTKDFSEWGEE